MRRRSGHACDDKDRKKSPVTARPSDLAKRGKPAQFRHVLAEQGEIKFPVGNGLEDSPSILDGRDPMAPRREQASHEGVLQIVIISKQNIEPRRKLFTQAVSRNQRRSGLAIRTACQLCQAFANQVCAERLCQMGAKAAGAGVRRVATHARRCQQHETGATATRMLTQSAGQNICCRLGNVVVDCDKAVSRGCTARGRLVERGQGRQPGFFLDQGAARFEPTADQIAVDGAQAGEEYAHALD